MLNLQTPVGEEKERIQCKKLNRCGIIMTKKRKKKQKSKPNRMVDISTMGVKHERAGTE